MAERRDGAVHGNLPLNPGGVPVHARYRDAQVGQCGLDALHQSVPDAEHVRPVSIADLACTDGEQVFRGGVQEQDAKLCVQQHDRRVQRFQQKLRLMVGHVHTLRKQETNH